MTTEQAVSKPIWEMGGAECDETASRIGYILQQFIEDGTWITTATCEATAEQVASVACGYDEKGKRTALARAAKHAGRYRVVDKRACVYLGTMPEPASDEPAPTGCLTKSLDEMSERELHHIAALIGCEIATWALPDGSGHYGRLWRKVGDEWSAGAEGGLDAMRALRRALGCAAIRTDRVYGHHGITQVWLGPLPIRPHGAPIYDWTPPVQEPATATHDAGQPETEKTCTCGLCWWFSLLRRWYTRGWTYEVEPGGYCPKCGCLLGDGVAHDPQAAMRRVQGAWERYKSTARVDEHVAVGHAIAALPVLETTGADAPEGAETSE